ncbi:MAG: DPP IV N-terminal domain-containing protein [Candidatus Desulfofervidus auxilii]|nr:DPP IV N-terminal domain-containing protein [Candidatus Desulfofervidus auxilii]
MIIPNLKREKLHPPPEYKIAVMCEESLKTKVYKWNGTTLSQLTSRDMTVFNHAYRAKGLINNNKNIIARYSDGQWITMFDSEMHILSFNEIELRTVKTFYTEGFDKLTDVTGRPIGVANNDRYIAIPTTVPNVIFLGWNGEDFTILDTLSTNDSPISCIFSPDSNYLIVLKYSSPHILVLKIEDDKLNLVNQYDVPSGNLAKSGAFSPNGNYFIVSYLGDSQIYEFDNGTLTPITTIGNTSLSWDIQFSPDGQYIAFVDYDKNLQIYNFDGSHLTHITTYGSNGMSNACAWSPDGNYIAFGKKEAYENKWYIQIFEWDGTSLNLKYQSPNVGDYFQRPCFSKDQNYFAVVIGCQLHIYHFLNGQLYYICQTSDTHLKYGIKFLNNL